MCCIHLFVLPQKIEFITKWGYCTVIYTCITKKKNITSCKCISKICAHTYANVKPKMCLVESGTTRAILHNVLHNNLYLHK
jgi:hypothetical protein